MDLNNIQIAPQRQGMTYIPEMLDDATGEPIPGTDRVAPSHLTNWEGQDPTDYEDVEQDAFHPDEQDPDMEIRLAETFEELNTTKYDVNPAFAFEVASADIGGSRADSAVQLFTSQVFNGDLTPEEAFNAAIGTGISADELMQSYYKLQRHFNQ